jgi:inosose dehydratase
MHARMAAAPVSWGVSDLPGWGYQMSRERVLAEARKLGFHAIEAGPEGWLPDDPGLTAQLLKRHRLKLAAGHVEAVLHRADVRREQLARVERRALWLSAAGAEVLIVVAASGRPGYRPADELTQHNWLQLLDGVASVMEIGARRGLPVALHPHFGTVIERPQHIERLLVASEVSLCLDAGHLYLGGCDPLDIVHMAPARIRHVHLKDVDSWLGSMVAAGELDYLEGVRRGLFRPTVDSGIGLKALVGELRAARYGGWYVLEQELALPEEPAAGDGPAADVERTLASV